MNGNSLSIALCLSDTSTARRVRRLCPRRRVILYTSAPFRQRTQALNGRRLGLFLAGHDTIFKIGMHNNIVTRNCKHDTMVKKPCCILQKGKKGMLHIKPKGCSYCPRTAKKPCDKSCCKDKKEKKAEEKKDKPAKRRIAPMAVQPMTSGSFGSGPSGNNQAMRVMQAARRLGGQGFTASGELKDRNTPLNRRIKRMGRR